MIVALHGLYDAVPLLVGTGLPITQVPAYTREEMARVTKLVGRYAVTWES